ncbi:MAG: SDR family oxidoreductase [Alphaproteobacteria bacterium]
MASLVSYNLSGKRALVTGGASGIGLGAVERFARSGASVVMNDLPSSNRLPAEAARLRAEGLDVHAVAGNVGDAKEASAIVADSLDRLGGLDYLVNNAGTPATREPIPPADLEAMTPEFWSKILSVNLLGAFWMTKAAAAALRASEGAVVNTVSDAAFGGGASSLAYACAKTALVRQTELLAKALAPRVRVNGIAPGYVNSNWECSFGDKEAAARERVPLARVGQPEDYAEMIVFFAAGALYMTGEVVIVNGGTRL